MINCITATGHCLTNSIDDISVVLKLLLKDEFMANYNMVSNLKKKLTSFRKLRINLNTNIYSHYDFNANCYLL